MSASEINDSEERERVHVLQGGSVCGRLIQGREHKRRSRPRSFPGDLLPVSGKCNDGHCASREGAVLPSTSCAFCLPG